jgi:hypothetical protein
MASRYSEGNAVPQSLWGAGIAPAIGQQVVEKFTSSLSIPGRVSSRF